MGTASKFTGPSAASALVPTWLDEPEVLPPPGLPPPPLKTPPGGGDDKDAAPPPLTQPALPDPRPPLQPPENPSRFTSARRSFNDAARTGDRGSLRRGLSSYVRTGTGGSRAATRRMGSALRAAGRIAGFVQDVRQGGAAAALVSLGMASLLGQPAEAALAALTDVFCPAGGPIDPAIARDAWDQAVLTLAEQGIADITLITPEQWDTLLAEFITNSVEARVFNDIGPKGISLPQDIRAIDQLQANLHEIIRGAVDDAIGGQLDGGRALPQSEVQATVTEVYDHAFAYLEALQP